MQFRLTLLISFYLFSTKLIADQRFSLESEALFLNYPQTSRYDEAESSSGRIFLSPNYRFKLKEYRLQVTGQAYYENNNTQLYDFNELYFSARPSSWTFTVGLQSFNWSTFDLVPDFSYLNPPALLSPLTRSQLGTGAVHIKYSFGPSSYELAYIPKQRQTILPSETSRWWPRDIDDLKNTLLKERTDISEVQTNEAPEYQIDNFQELDNSRTNNLAMRWKAVTDWGDFSLAGFEGMNPYPTFVAQINSTVIDIDDKIVAVQNPIQIQPIAYRTRAVSGTWVYPGEYAIYRLGVTNNEPIGDDAALPEGKTMGIGAIEKSWALGKKSLTTVAQFTYANVDSTTNQLSRLTALYDQSVSIGGYYPVTDDLEIKGLALLDLQNNGQIYTLDFIYSLSDRWKARLGGSAFQGDVISLPGLYNKNDFAYAGFQCLL